METKDVRQSYELDAASVYYAYTKRFRYFKVCNMQTHGGNRSILFYEFDISGVILESSAETQYASDFIAALHVDQDFKVIARPAINDKLISKNVELKKNGIWVHGMISQETTDKVCIKRYDEELVSFVWMKRKDIPQKLRFAIKRRGEMSKYSFAAAIGTHGDDNMHRNLTGCTFQNDTDFEIPLWDKVLYTKTSDTGPHNLYMFHSLFSHFSMFWAFHIVTVVVYAKKSYNSYGWMTIKKIKFDALARRRFATNDKFEINNKLTMRSSSFESFEVFAASDIIIRETGEVTVSGGEMNEEDAISEKSNWNYRQSISHSKAGLICFISGGNVVNKGTLSCKVADRWRSSGGAVYINTDGVFENKGVIDCGRGGHVHIECAEFKNNGKIIPEPVVTYKKSKHRTMVRRVTARERSRKINMKVVRHRGHYSSYKPEYLVQEGTSYYYYSQYGIKTSMDWMVFKAQHTERVYPTDIVIRNSAGSSGIKRIRIDGSADGTKFEEWIEFGNIHKNDRDSQTFPVDPTSGMMCSCILRFFHSKIDGGSTPNMMLIHSLYIFESIGFVVRIFGVEKSVYILQGQYA